MKKFVSLALACVALSAAVGTFAATSHPLRGSDGGLGSMTQEVLDVCTAAQAGGGITYVGGGSSKGEDAMLAGTQEVAPMSRFLDPDRACRATHPQQAEGLRVALGAVAIVGDASNTQCAEDGVAVQGECFAVSNLNGIAGIQCPGCETGNTRYCFSSELDALRILFAGMHKNAGSAIANKDCNSDVRRSLANDWDALNQGTCSAGECSQLAHAWRPDDLSEVTPAFLELLGLPPISAKPFCNGSASEELDPIRRPCAENDTICQADGTSGLVLPIFVPDGNAVPQASQGHAYMSAVCQPGKFALAEAQVTDVGGGALRYDCPERGNFSIAGFCLAPQTNTGKFDCNSPANNPNVFFAHLNDDARLFNRWTRLPTGALLKDNASRPQTFGWHKMRDYTCVPDLCLSNCRSNSSTLNIGCLSDQYSCSIGVAARDAYFYSSATIALRVKGVAPDDENVLEALMSPASSDAYPLTHPVYVNSLVGFENVSDAREAGLAGCFADEAIAAATTFWPSLIPFGEPAPCRDFDETLCNGLVLRCDTNAECGAAGSCVGGNPATTLVKEGTCNQACVSSAQCTQGRTCDASGRCMFANNTNACAQ